MVRRTRSWSLAPRSQSDFVLAPVGTAWTDSFASVGVQPFVRPIPVLVPQPWPWPSFWCRARGPASVARKRPPLGPLIQSTTATRRSRRRDGEPAIATCDAPRGTARCAHRTGTVIFPHRGRIGICASASLPTLGSRRNRVLFGRRSAKTTSPSHEVSSRGRTLVRPSSPSSRSSRWPCDSPGPPATGNTR